MSGKPRILAIRGGAIGDFLLTLPALRLLRETFGHCHLEILGYRHIADLALQGGPTVGLTYADAIRNIEAAPLAGFFARAGNLDQQWCDYFGGFNQVVSWLFDPDSIFENNVRRAGVKNYLSAYAKISDENHASVQLAHGLQGMALYLEDAAARLVPTVDVQHLAEEWLAGSGIASDTKFVAIHPGSGSAKKNWPVERWVELAKRFTAAGERLLVVGGEADHAILAKIEEQLAGLPLVFARDLPLPLLGAILVRATGYFGHDTGVSHLASAVGVPSTVIFGTTDPAVWAPRGNHVRVVAAPRGDLHELGVEDVM
jgi:heptosyltransferase III